MALKFLDPDQQQAFAFFVAMMVICSVATALRFWAGYRSGKRFQAEDGLALASLVAFLTFGGLIISGSLDTLLMRKPIDTYCQYCSSGHGCQCRPGPNDMDSRFHLIGRKGNELPLISLFIC